jgi:hypothetical protein
MDRIPMSTAAVRPDPIVRAHQDAAKAIATFLPSLTGRNDHPDPTPPPHPMAKTDSLTEAIRVASLANKGERMSARMARGLPPEDPQHTPEAAFGNQLDSVHTRAIQEAIARVPEEERGKFISEAHDSAVKWIGAHNGKVIVHGKVELAHSPESAERLAAKIVNNEVEGHDRRVIAIDEAGASSRTSASGRATEGEPGGSGHSGVSTDLSDNSAADVRRPLPRTVAGTSESSGASAPEIVPPGDGDQPAQGAPPAVTSVESDRVGSRKSDGHQVTQPKNSIPANQKLALDAAPELHAALSALTQQVPGTKFDRLRPQKATDRLDQKVEDNNDPDTLSDYLGAQVAADTPQAKDAMIDALKKNFKVIEVDDEFLTGRKDKAQYPSANVQVQLSNGLTAEVQIVPREVQDSTEQSHQFYKAGREAEERGDHGERDRQWKKAADINQGALAQFKSRNRVGDSQQNQVGGYEVLGQPITIGKHTFLRVKTGGASGTPETVDSQDAPQREDVPTGTSPAGTSQADNLPQDGESGTGDGAAGGEKVSGSEGTETSRYARGNTVTLKDGTPITIAYVDPDGNFVRGHRPDGHLVKYIDVKDIANAEA